VRVNKIVKIDMPTHVETVETEPCATPAATR
jgi:hypothetical protein